ncbi:MAG: tetratricopeptide repeat protein, partial [Puniceicoccales bacterium]
YMFAHHQLGRIELRNGMHEKALRHFRDAQTLPRNLEAGLWSETWLVPHQIYEAQCLEALGRKDDSLPIYRHILEFEIEYFSNMHLPELPVYQARALQAMGQFARAERILRDCLRRWNQALREESGGFFTTTPFFISYIDQEQQARTGHFKYLTAKAKLALGDVKGAMEDLRTSQANDPAKLPAWMDLKDLQEEEHQFTTEFN